MKIFYTVILCLCAISAYSQTTIAKDAGQKTNGSYSFLHATVAVRNSTTKADVLSASTFSDTTSLRKINELPLPPQPIFLTAHIQSGRLTGCTLWNNMEVYNVVDEGTLLLPPGQTEFNADKEEGNTFPQPYGLSPQYSLVIEGNTAIFTFCELYGHSQYNFTLESTITVTLIRDEPYNKTL